MKTRIVSLLLIISIGILSNCSNPNSSGPQTILHPNKDSELTLLMREMYDYYDNLKVDIQNGELPDNIKTFTEIHKAVATEPSKSESPLYQAMSTVYLESAKRLGTSKENLAEHFNLMVDNCMNCHKQMCPGPMVKIKKLYVKKD